MSNGKLLTAHQVADRLQVNERTVTQWLRRGRLRGFKIGQEWRVSSRDLEAFQEHRASVSDRNGAKHGMAQRLSK
jgi:excisionase family DNA binding protein